jgi:hypothetical protein
LTPTPRRAQRFLFTNDQIVNVFSRRPAQDTAAELHTASNQDFIAWAEATGVAMAV